MATEIEIPGESVPSHLFVELTSLAELSFPTTASSRIKYTCVCASPHILAVGSSSGTVYVFSRYAAKNRKSLCNVPVQVIPCQEGAITLVEISPDEKSVAVATSRGFICVLNISRNHSMMILNSVLHVASEVTCFRFSLNGSRLFAGDSLGRVSCSKLLSKLSLRSPCELILRLDSRVVQIDQFHAQLVVSTLSRCFLHNMARQTTCQIGSKLRNGVYGACFFSSDGASDDNASSDNAMVNYSPLIFCARPGGRLWEVDHQGKVYSTHQFGGARNIWGVPGFREFDVKAADNASNVTFGTVFVINDFVLSAVGRTLFLVDPKRGKLVLVADVGEDIAQFNICANDVFLLTADGYLRKVTLFPLEKAIEKLQFRERFNAAGRVVCAVHDIDNGYRLRMDLLRDVRGRLDSLPESVTLVEKIDAIITDVANKVFETRVNRVPQVARLASGIHKVVKGMENSGYEDDFTFRMPSNRQERNSRDRTMSRSPYSSLTRRSKSTSAVKKFTTAGGNETFVDVPLDGEMENRAQGVSVNYDDNNGGGDDNAVSNFRTLVDIGMNGSRSEESLLAMLGGSRKFGDGDEELDDGDLGENGAYRLSQSTSQSNRLPLSMSERPVGGHGRSTASTVYSTPNANQIFMDTMPLLDDPLSLTPAALKETLISGGKFLMDAVQKMSLLSMGPDFGDPTYLINGSNGYYSRDDREPEDDGETESESLSRTMGSDVVVAQIMLEEELDSPVDRKPMTETPVVQRVLHSAAGSRARVKRAKRGGKTNGYVVTENANAADRSLGNSTKEGIGRLLLGADTEYKKVEDGPVIGSPSKPVKRMMCEYCGLHNSWRFALTVGPFVENVDLKTDYFKEGGLPIDTGSWKNLIVEWKKRKHASSEQSSAQLCSECSRLISSWFSHNDSAITGSSVRKTADHSVRAIEPVLASLPESSMVRLFGQSTKRQISVNSEKVKSSSPIIRNLETSRAVNTNISIVKVDDGREEESPMAVSMYYNPLYESVYNGEDVSESDNQSVWKWLSVVPLDVLLSVGGKTIGIDAIMEILLATASEYGKDLSGEFYRSISKDNPYSMNLKVLKTIAEDAFKLRAEILQTGTDEDVQCKAVRIDVREFCPCCTLPLTSVVAETEQRIFIFDCGHSYHKICLLAHATQPYSCLVCTLA